MTVGGTARVRVAPGAPAADYAAVVRDCGWSMLYAADAYHRFLQRVIPGTATCHLVAYDGNEPVGALPALRTVGRTGGDVINSLPFFGSNGGFLVTRQARDPRSVRRALADAWNAMTGAPDIVAATLVTNPLDPHGPEAGSLLQHDWVEERTGQLTQLPGDADPASLRESLFERFHQKTRNAIRKAEKSGLQVRRSGDEADLRALAELHQGNMAAIGVAPKPWPVFTALRETFEYGHGYEVLVATTGDGAVAAALLVLFHDEVAEYFVPAIDPAARPLQPMNLLVLHAMTGAVTRGCRWWNWGGTAPGQAGVYQFKSRWGTTDHPYRYFIRCNDRRVLDRTRADLLDEYPYFFVVPFTRLLP